MNPESVHKLTRPLQRAVLALVTRGTVLASTAAGLRVRLKVSLRQGELADDVELLEAYGYSAPPLPDRDSVLTLAVGGNGAHRVALAAGGRAHRPRDLEPGEVCLYTDEGDEIRFKRGRKISVIGGESVDIQTKAATVVASESADVQTKVATVNASTRATITSPQVTLDAAATHCTGNLSVDGNIAAPNGSISAPSGSVSDQTSSMQAMRDVYNTHDHTGDSGGTTESPNQAMGS